MFQVLESLYSTGNHRLLLAVTWAMAQVLRSYFPLVKEGKTWDKGAMRSAMKEALRRAKSINWKKELGNSITSKEMLSQSREIGRQVADYVMQIEMPKAFRIGQ